MGLLASGVFFLCLVILYIGWAVQYRLGEISDELRIMNEKADKI